jgi:hypothetical protein
MDGARAIRNRSLTCDWCGEVPPWIYLPPSHAGVFCETCVGDVMSPPPKAPVALARDGMPSDDVVELSRKLSAYLKRFPAEPVHCGRGRPRRA